MQVIIQYLYILPIIGLYDMYQSLHKTVNYSEQKNFMVNRRRNDADPPQKSLFRRILGRCANSLLKKYTRLWFYCFSHLDIIDLFTQSVFFVIDQFIRRVKTSQGIQDKESLFFVELIAYCYKMHTTFIFPTEMHIHMKIYPEKRKGREVHDMSAIVQFNFQILHRPSSIDIWN